MVAAFVAYRFLPNSSHHVGRGSQADAAPTGHTDVEALVAGS